MSGFKSKAGFKFDTTDYGDSETIAGNDQLHILSEGIVPMVGHDEGSIHTGKYLSKDSLLTDRRSEGNLSEEVYYGDMNLMACALGMSHDNSPINPTGSVYEHYFEPDYDLATREITPWDNPNNILGKLRRRGTLCIDKDQDIWQFNSAMVQSMTIEISVNSITRNYSLVANPVKINADQNTISDGWDFLDGGRALFTHCTVYLKKRDIFTVNSSYNALVINETTNITITLEDGIYSGYQYAKHIENKLNSDSQLTGQYTVNWNPFNRKFTFEGDTSFSIKGANFATEIEHKIGFPSDTSSAKRHVSEVPAGPDTYEVWANADKINVSNIRLNYNNNFQINNDSLSKKDLQEPFVNSRSGNGDMELPRYSDSNFINEINGEDIYEMKIVLTGDQISGSYYEGLEFHLPQIKISSFNASVSGDQKVLRNLNFEILDPIQFLDFQNFHFGFYYERPLPEAPDSGYEFYCMGIYQGKLIGGAYSTGATESKIYQLDDDGWNLLFTTTGSLQVYCMKEFGDELYIGFSDGKIRNWNGSFSGEVNDMGTDPVKDLEVYDDKIWAIDNGGVIDYSSDGTSWSNSTDLGATVAWRLKRYNGALIALARVTTNKVFKYISSWSSVLDTGGTASYMSMDIWGGLLIVSSGQIIQRYDGTTFTPLTNLSTDTRHLLNFNGNLIAFQTAASAPYVYDVPNETDYIPGWINFQIREKPWIFEGKMIFTIQGLGLYYFNPHKMITIKATNTVPWNPIMTISPTDFGSIVRWMRADRILNYGNGDYADNLKNRYGDKNRYRGNALTFVPTLTYNSVNGMPAIVQTADDNGHYQLAANCTDLNFGTDNFSVIYSAYMPSSQADEVNVLIVKRKNNEGWELFQYSNHSTYWRLYGTVSGQIDVEPTLVEQRNDKYHWYYCERESGVGIRGTVDNGSLNAQLTNVDDIDNSENHYIGDEGAALRPGHRWTEILIFTRLLTAAERTMIHNYLDRKYEVDA